MMAAASYYQQVVTATQEFLGPAAERFINRQINFHLNKEPETITRDDVLKLKDSLRVALGLLADDTTVVDRAVKKLETIAKEER